MDSVRMGVIGIGGMGTGYAKRIQAGDVPRCELTAVCDIDSARFAAFPGVPAYEDSGELIRSGEQHLGIKKNFVEAILDGKELIAPAAEGIRSVELANAMLYSALSRTAVALPLDSAMFERFLMKLIDESTYVKKVDGGTDLDLSRSF